MKLHVALSLALILLLLSGAGGLTAYFVLSRPKPEENTPQRPITTVVAPKVEALRDHQVRIVGFGSARPRVQLDIAPEVAGKVVFKAANFLSGEFVRRGQRLLEIDKTDYVQARDAAQRQIDLLDVRLKQLDVEAANLKAMDTIEGDRVALAEEQLAKKKALLSRGAASENDIDSAQESVLLHRTLHQTILSKIALVGPQRSQLKAEAAVTAVQLARAETAISRTTITSPVTGRVLGCDVEVGEWVSVGQPCGQLYGMEVMDVPVSIAAGDLHWLDRPGPTDANGDGAAGKPNVEITATVVWQQPDNGERMEWTGRVNRIEGGLAAQTRTATVVVEVANPPPGAGKEALERNMFCQVTIAGRTVSLAYVLPRQALLPDGKVYVVQDGKLGSRSVEPARLTGTEAMFLPDHGIEAGDRVITRYVPKPVLGMKVEVVDSLEEGSGKSPASGGPKTAAGPPPPNGNQKQ